MTRTRGTTWPAGRTWRARPGHWIAAYGWSGTGGLSHARIYYADSSTNQGGGTGKYWNLTADIAALIGEHTRAIRLVRRARLVAAVAVMALGGVVACSGATPPTTPPDLGGARLPEPGRCRARTRSVEQPDGRERGLDLGIEIDVGPVARVHVTVLEFASTGGR